MGKSARHRVGRPKFDPARRPALCERRHPHRHARQQDAEGHRRQEPQMAGFDAHYVPGWDCHGMPIEIQIEKKYGKNLPTREVQAHSRAYATEQIERQKKDFMRLGVLGLWNRPYKTMDFKNEADEIRALGEDHGQGFCVPRPEAGQLVLRLRLGAGGSGSGISGQVDRRSMSHFHCATIATKLARAFGLRRCPTSRCFAVIWTTTPWTIPANQALNVHPDFDYDLVRHRARAAGAGAGLADACLRALRLDRRGRSRQAHGRGARAARLPPSVLRPRGRRSTWASMSHSIPVPASSTRRRPTASRTSCLARRTA